MTVIVQKQQIYQMWNSDSSVYLGVIQGVTTKFKRVQDINTVGPSTIQIDFAMSVDTASQPVKAITTEDGLWITTEDNIGLTTEGEQPNFGFDKTKVRNGNIVKIIEINDYHPNGITVFNGRVKKWNVNYGGSNKVSLYVEPLSADTNNKLVKSVEALSYSQLVQDSSSTVYGGAGGGGSRRYMYLFDFPTRGISTLSSVIFMLAAMDGSSPTTVTLSVVNLGPTATYNNSTMYYADDPSNYVATSTITVTGTTPTEYKLPFTIPANIPTSNFYGLLLTSTGTNTTGTRFYYSSTSQTGTGGALAGASYHSDAGAAWSLGVTGPSDANSEMYFKFYYIPPYTKATITNFEPSALLKTIINNYNAEGGVVTYTPTSIQTTGITISSYTFQTKTVAEGLDILLSLSPAGFYYAIDPGTNVLTFKRINTTADHIIKFKQHPQTLDLSASIENLRNSVYFTGGLVGTTNIYTQKQVDSSVLQFGTQIDRESDVSVTNSSTAAQITQNYLDKLNAEAYETALTLIDGQTDITTYQLGETIGFEGFGAFPDTVIIPVVRLSRDMDTLDLNLGSLPVRQSTIIQDQVDNVQSLTTVANPQQPS